MARTIDVVKALDGITYDMDMWLQQGYGFEQAYLLTYKRLNNLSHDLKMMRRKY